MKSFKLILIGLILLLFVNFSGVEGRKNSVLELNEKNWRDILKGEWMIEFYAPKCPACLNLENDWSRFANSVYDKGVKVGRINVMESPVLSGRFFAKVLPEIYHVKNGDFRVYKGTRDTDSFVKFIKNSQWKEVKKMSYWKKPSALHMETLYPFLKLSHGLKSLNTKFQENLRIPAWCSYALIGTLTLALGGVVGLGSIFAFDFYMKYQERLHTQGPIEPIAETVTEPSVELTSSPQTTDVTKEVRFDSDKEIPNEPHPEKAFSSNPQPTDEQASSSKSKTNENRSEAQSSKEKEQLLIEGKPNKEEKQPLSDPTKAFTETVEIQRRRLIKPPPIVAQSKTSIKK